jgi:ABC-type amino acid transport system permease subunit
LLFRVYIRFTERIIIDREEIGEAKKIHINNFEDFKHNLKRLFSRPFSFLEKKFEPVIPDVLFSISILLFTFGIFRIAEWQLNYPFTLNRILDLEPFTIFVFGLILLFYSSKMSSMLELEGLNTFTEDSSPEAANRRLQLWSVVILLVVSFFYLSISAVQPNLITEKNGEELSWGQWAFEEGTYDEVSAVFINLMLGLTLYTAAQIAEVVRGSIQSLPRGQIEAAISMGLSPFQRLRLIILPQALRSMIPSLTNQYLNCWKNSSLALLVGFSDFYFVLNNIVNNAGHAVPIFIIILLTYQSGSLLISSVMNTINSSVTKVKI